MKGSLLDAVGISSQSSQINLDLGGNGNTVSYNMRDYQDDIDILYNRRYEQQEVMERAISAGMNEVGCTPIDTSIGLVIMNTNLDVARVNIDIYPNKPTWSELVLLSHLSCEQLSKVCAVTGTITNDIYDVVLGLIKIFTN